MTVLYNIPIPAPAGILQQLAQVRMNDVKIYEFFWRPETRQVVFRHPDNTWYIQPDGSITASLATILNCIPQNIILKNFCIFERPGESHLADAESTVEFYDCDWSDYASDFMSLQFDIEIDTSSTTNVKRLLKVVRGIIKDEEDYADMPALIPIERSYKIERKLCPHSRSLTMCDNCNDGEGISYCECMD